MGSALDFHPGIPSAHRSRTRAHHRRRPEKKSPPEPGPRPRGSEWNILAHLLRLCSSLKSPKWSGVGEKPPVADDMKWRCMVAEDLEQVCPVEYDEVRERSDFEKVTADADGAGRQHRDHVVQPFSIFAGCHP